MYETTKLFNKLGDLSKKKNGTAPKYYKHSQGKKVTCVLWGKTRVC